jgi:hypothetical protein
MIEIYEDFAEFPNLTLKLVLDTALARRLPNYVLIRGRVDRWFNAPAEWT